MQKAMATITAMKVAALSLEGLEFTEGIVPKLVKHTKSLQQAYNEVKQLVLSWEDKGNEYARHINTIQAAITWYENKCDHVVKSLSQSLRPAALKRKRSKAISS